MLDDANYIKQFDNQDALGVIAQHPQQLQATFSVDVDIDASAITQIVVAGMGGSALAGAFVRDWWRSELPISLEVVRDYRLPAFVDQNTLVMVSSYSGNTEETLAAYQDAGTRGAQRVVVTTGGELADRAATDGVPVYELPSGYQPRMAVWYNIAALTHLAERLGVLEAKQQQLEAAMPLLEAAAKSWTPDVATADNPAKQYAEMCLGKAVWILGSNSFQSATYHWKAAINENAKHVATYNVLPEFNHNEFLGWTEHPRHKPFTVIQLRSNLEHECTQRRFDVTNRLLSGRMPAPLEIELAGETHIQQLLWASLLGDFISVYLGILNNVNPTQVEAIERFKRELG